MTFCGKNFNYFLNKLINWQNYCSLNVCLCLV